MPALANGQLWALQETGQLAHLKLACPAKEPTPKALLLPVHAVYSTVTTTLQHTLLPPLDTELAAR